MKLYILKLTAFALTLFAATGIQAQQVITTYAGQVQSPGYTGDNGPATDANLNNPSDIITDGSGNVIFADFINNVVRKIDASGVIHTIAGTGFGAGSAGGGNYSGDGGPATAAELNGPFAIAMDKSGNLYVADGYNHVVRKINSAGIITAFAGKYSAFGYSGDGGPATDAGLNNPVGLAVDKGGNVYIADDHNNVIRKVDNAGIITTVAGKQILGPGHTGDGGPALVAQMDLPIGVAFDTADNMYIADAHNNVIRKVDKAGIITTYAGAADYTSGYTGDGGAATLAKLDSPERVSFDDANNLYISDYYNNVIRKVNTVTGIISTYAGNGVGAGTIPTSGGFSGEDSAATNAGLFLPHGIAFDNAHNAYIADRANELIRKIGPKPVIDHSGIHDVNGTTSLLKVYPNPARAGMMVLSLAAEHAEQVTIVMTNVLGQSVQQASTITNKATYLKIDATAGVYNISATTTKGRWNSQVVIQ
ncbi:MAG: hypothetical protein JWQ38_552 [Flavipsychrobacter sp.]|nr:hypothetical protein [Flavipsychrobacter sp.]